MTPVLRHDYLRRVAADRREADLLAPDPLRAFLRVFYPSATDRYLDALVRRGRVRARLARREYVKLPDLGERREHVDRIVQAVGDGESLEPVAEGVQDVVRDRYRRGQW